MYAEALRMTFRGRRRRAKVTLASLHDRRAADLPINAVAGPAIVDDPNPTPGNTLEKLQVLRSLRDDPLAHLHSRRQIDDAQFMAGREWQRHYESSGIGGVRAIDITREYVDGRRFVDALSDVQQAAVRKLAALDRALGQEGCALVRDVLGKGWETGQCAAARGLIANERNLKYLGRRFRECLDTLANELGYASKRT